jgi:hypothetical protein
MDEYRLLFIVYILSVVCLILFVQLMFQFYKSLRSSPMCSSFATPFGRAPLVVVWSSPIRHHLLLPLVVPFCSSFASPFGHRVPAPLFLCSVNYSLLKYFLCIGKPMI